MDDEIRVHEWYEEQMEFMRESLSDEQDTIIIREN